MYDPDRDTVGPEDSDLDSETSDTDVSDVMSLYPEISDAVKLASQRCTCGCADPMYALKGGCLQSLMYAQVVLLVGHAMAESSGAVDISHVRSGTSGHYLISATTRFLDNIATQGLILWGDWFRLVAVAVTGLPDDLGIRSPADDAGEIMCWVAGSMSVVPSWLALDEEIKLEGSWSIRTLVGCPMGVTDEKAIIKPQATNPAQQISIPHPCESATHIYTENEEPQMQSAIFSNSGACFRLMILVKTAESLRCLNPNEVYKGYIHSLSSNCTHASSALRKIHPWTMSKILQSWDGKNTFEGPLPHFGFVGSSSLKRNIAVGLAGEGCVIQTRKCCCACFVRDTLANRKIGIAFERSKDTAQLTSH